jgi:HK97 gp10 family phage protein
MSVEIRFDVKGQDQLLNNFRTLATKIQRDLNKHALNAAAEPIMDAARDFAPVGTGPGAGALRNSIGIQLTSKDKWQHAKIGPRKGKKFRVAIGTKTKGKNKGKPKYNSPSKYKKFVEFGTKHSAARPFMRPAFAAEGGTKAVDRYIEDLKDGIALEVAKLPKTA